MPNSCIDIKLMDVFLKCFGLLCTNSRISLKISLSLLKLVIVGGFGERGDGKSELKIV